MFQTSSELATFNEAVTSIYHACLEPAQGHEVFEAIRTLLAADTVEMVGATEDGARVSERGYTLVLALARKDGAPDRLIVRRQPGRVAFDNKDLGILELLRPHLENAARLRANLDLDRLGHLACRHLVAGMLTGIVLADTDGRVLWSNEAGRSIITEGSGLVCKGDRLQTARSFEAARLDAMLKATGTGRSGALLIGRSGGRRPLGLIISPLPAEIAAEAGAQRLALVAIKEVEHHTGRIAMRLRVLFGMTQAEEQLAVLLLAGANLQEAAQQAGKSLATVKTQLRSLLRKTGTRSQAELMQALHALPDML